MRTPLSCLYVKDDEYGPSGVMPEISKMLFFITLKTFILLKKKKKGQRSKVYQAR